MTSEKFNLENQLLEHNQPCVEEVFKMYESLNFIYAGKMELLNPVIDIVKENWRKLLQSKFPLFWLITLKQNSHNLISTGTIWQSSNAGLIAQHLASNNPIASRVLILGMLSKIIEHQNCGLINSFQVYYSPNNKYSSRMFEPLSLKAGNKISEIIPLSYFRLPLLTDDQSSSIEISEIMACDDYDFTRFLMAQKGEIFIRTQGLNDKDLNLKELDERFNCYGLKRTRRLFAARYGSDNRIYGLIIINQCSLGINFSFFENSCEIILCKESSPEFLFLVAEQLYHKASALNSSSTLKWLPLFINPIHSDIVKRLNGKFIRSYNLFMILKGGFECWYTHIDLITSLIFQRFINNFYAKS